MNDRRRIQALFGAGMRPSAIAEVVGCSRSSVYRALEPGARLDYERPTMYQRFGARVEALLAAYPRMDCVALAYQSGWPGSLRQLEREVQARRPTVHAPSSVPIQPFRKRGGGLWT